MIGKKSCEVMSYASVQLPKQNPHGIARMGLLRLRNLHKNISRPHEIEISKRQHYFNRHLATKPPGMG